MIAVVAESGKVFPAVKKFTGRVHNEGEFPVFAIPGNSARPDFQKGRSFCNGKEFMLAFV